MLWDVEWLVKTGGGRRNVPAFDFLLSQPPAVRIQLLAIVDAVRSTGPHQWRDTSSHDSMHGACEHLHEARDRHGQMLYRLYLLWQKRKPADVAARSESDHSGPYRGLNRARGAQLTQSGG
jgi:hypothetical protein